MITFIVPTIGRPSLQQTLDSIETRPGDEILVVCAPDVALRLGRAVTRDPRVRVVHCERGNDWGHTERNFATPLARCRYIAHIDDDDRYARGTRELMADAIATAFGKPIIFRMQYPNGITLWQEPVVRCGNVGTPMFLIPNRPTMLGRWAPFVGGDCHFLETSKWDLTTEYVWRPEVIALLGHN